MEKLFWSSILGSRYIFIKKAQAPTARVVCINRVRSMVKALQAIAKFLTAPAQIVSSGLICLYILGWEISG